MQIREKIKKLLLTNPIAKHRIQVLRKGLVNSEVSFLTPNCLGGILLHDLGLRFLSPTVNLMMYQKDFLQLVLHLEDYLNGSFRFVDLPEHECPCAYLSADGLDEEVLIVFTHYKNEEDALKKWNDRKQRINRENLFVFIEERDGITKKDIEKLADLQVKGVVAFTCNRYDDLPYSVFIQKYQADGEVGNILKKSHISGHREYEDYFDFVKWFNEADGYPFSVDKFIRK